VVAFGFLPLMVAQLIPYKTTAVLLFGILFFSGSMTLLLLPALLTVGETWFFGKRTVDRRGTELTKGPAS
jgi:hypothetical protein